jgi:hypothetical protein
MERRNALCLVASTHHVDAKGCSQITSALILQRRDVARDGYSIAVEMFSHRKISVRENAFHRAAATSATTTNNDRIAMKYDSSPLGRVRGHESTAQEIRFER